MKTPLAPHITEKTYRGIAEDKSAPSTYTFRVRGDFDKAEIKKMIEDEYKVSVTDVRTVNLPAKNRRFRNIPGKTSPVVKALVRLKQGDTISAFDIDEQKASGQA